MIFNRFVLFYCEIYIVLKKKSESLNEMCIRFGNMYLEMHRFILAFPLRLDLIMVSNLYNFFSSFVLTKGNILLFEYLIVQSTKINGPLKSIFFWVNISSNVLSINSEKNYKIKIDNNKKETNSNGIQNQIFGSFSEKEFAHA